MRLLALLLFAAAAYAQIVQGVVINSANKKPVPGAVVELSGATGEGADPDVYRAQADGAGHFRFSPVAPGRYRAAASAQGFIRVGPRAEPVTVEAAGRDITLSLVPASVITGRVVDGDGDPIPYVSVEAIQYGYQSGKKALQTTAGARTDDHGEYRIFELQPGHYYVRATYRAGPSTAYAPAFFPAAPEISGATLLDTAPGGELRAIDLMLHAGAPHSISGKAVDGQTGQPATNVYVTARMNSDQYAGGAAQTKDSFTIANLIPGKYLLSAQEFTPGGPAKTGRVAVDLGNADISGVVLTLNPGTEISGIVRDLPDNAAQVHLSLEPENTGGDSFSVNVTARGTFAFHNVHADVYRLTWNLPKGVYVKWIKMGDRLLKDDRVDLSGAAGPLTIQLAADGGRVQGTVRDAEGKPVPGAFVTMTSEPSYDFWSATADDTGHFEIRDIAPGDYRLLAFQDAPEGAPNDPDFRKPYQKSAALLQVLPSTQQKLDLVAIAPR